MKLWEMFLAGLLSEQEFFSLLAEGSLYGDLAPVMEWMDMGMRSRFKRWKSERLPGAEGRLAA